MINLLGFPYSVIEMLDKESPGADVFSRLPGSRELHSRTQIKSSEAMKGVVEAKQAVERADESLIYF